MPASNTKECFREFVGKRINGVMFDAMPFGRRDLQAGSKTIIFEDGRGLTIAGNGSFWIDSAEEVERAVRSVKIDLERAHRDLQDVLSLAGVNK